MNKTISANSKIRLVLAIFAISLMALSCGNTDPVKPVKPVKPVVPFVPFVPFVEFPLDDVPLASAIPVENVWIITDGGKPTTAEFDKLEALLKSKEVSGRKIKLQFLNIIAIPEQAFYDSKTEGVKTIVSVFAPKATSIGQWAFRDALLLTTVSFPLAITIEGFAFNGCTALTDVSLPLATTIGDSAFNGCTALTTVSLPLVETIGDSAFYRCTALEAMTIATGSNLASIHKYAFGGGVDTTAITVTTSAANKAKFQANSWDFKFTS